MHEADGGAHEAPLNRVLGQVERQVTRRVEIVLAEEKLTIDQWRVLDLLADGEGHPMSEIASNIVVPGPSLTKIVDRLVDAASVYRLVDDRDRRRVLAFISEHGRCVRTRLAERVAEAERQALTDLAEDAPLLRAMLLRLAETPQVPGENSPSC